MKLDVANRNSTVWILLALDLFFFNMTIALHLWGGQNGREMASKVWEIFLATNGPLLLALRIDKVTPQDPPPPPGGGVPSPDAAAAPTLPAIPAEPH